MIKYGIRKIGDMLPVTYDTTPNCVEDCCVSIEHRLTSHHYEDEQMWLVDSINQAQWVLHNSTSWYNAGYETPKHTLKPEDYEIVRIEMIITKV